MDNLKEPTTEQIKEFWEWCGFYQPPMGRKGFHYELGEKVMDWLPPEGFGIYFNNGRLPSIDLNNLFKYAVPPTIEKLRKYDGHILSVSAARFRLFQKWLAKIEEGLSEELGLLWAIWEVIHEH